MAFIAETTRTGTHSSGVADTHLLTIAGATAVGVGVAGGTTVLGAVAPMVLGVGAGAVAGATMYRHWRFIDGLSDEQLARREQLLDDARNVGASDK